MQKRGCTPLAKIVTHTKCGVDPKIMGTRPMPAALKTIEKASWIMDDVDIFKLNETFAAQSIAVMRDLGFNSDRVNINGGALALGHPIGAFNVIIFFNYNMMIAYNKTELYNTDKKNVQFQ